MVNYGLKDKVALITGANNPHTQVPVPMTNK
jgi:hypothetical protein